MRSHPIYRKPGIRMTLPQIATKAPMGHIYGHDKHAITTDTQ